VRIKSLDNDFLESVIEFCDSHSELSAGYIQDEEDCRRVISVSCSQNKKGIVAKKELLDKFFGEKQVDNKRKGCPNYRGMVKKGKYYCVDCAGYESVGVPELYLTCESKVEYERIRSKCINGDTKESPLSLCRFYNATYAKAEEKQEPGIKVDIDTFNKALEYTQTCETCIHSSDYGESVLYIKCEEGTKAKDVKKTDSCANYVPADAELADEPEGDLEEQLETLLEQGDKKDQELLCTTCKYFHKSKIKYGEITGDPVYTCKEVKRNIWLNRPEDYLECNQYEVEEAEIYVYRGLV
jgi:hypothetical protein